MTTVALFAFSQPQRLQAGLVGADQRPFYWNCGECGAVEPLLVGKIADASNPHNVAVRKLPSGFYAQMYLCQPCYDAWLATIPALRSEQEEARA